MKERVLARETNIAFTVQVAYNEVGRGNNFIICGNSL